MTATPPAPAGDPKRTEEIRAANADSKQRVGMRGYCDDCDHLLQVLDAHRKEMEDMAVEHDKDLRILLGGLEQAKEALDIAYVMDCAACDDLGRDCLNCGKIDAARKRIDSLLHPK